MNSKKNYTLKQDSKFVIDIYSKLKTRWEELEIYVSIPNFILRVRCSHSAMHNAMRNHNLLYLIEILTSLNENLVIVKS